MLSRIYDGFIQSTVVILISITYLEGVHQFISAAV